MTKYTAVIITLAGASSRFSESLGAPAHKSIYTDGKRASILERQIRGIQAYIKNPRIFLVTGYMHNEVVRHLHSLCNIPQNITVVENTQWDKQGSAHSLYLGIEKVLKSGEIFDKVLFFEGDLIFNFKALQKFDKVLDGVGYVNKLIDSTVDVMGVAKETTPNSCKVQYYYSPDHTLFPHFNESLVKNIFASAQIWVWPFQIVKALQKECSKYLKTDNNLFIVGELEKYLSPELIKVNNWHNCNTIQEWRKI